MFDFLEEKWYIKESNRDQTVFASKPFVKRGGNCDNGTNAGVLYANITNGNANNNNGFRPVVVL